MGNKFKEIRAATGLTQKDFAEKLGIKQSHYSMIERGAKNPSFKVLDKLWGMGISSKWYFDNEGNMFKKVFETAHDVGINSNNNISQNNNLLYADFVEQMSNNTSDIIECNKDFITEYFNGSLMPYHYEYQKIRFYEPMALVRINQLIDLKVEDFERAYNDNVSLRSFLNYLNPPDFLKEKFPPISPFPNYLKELDEEFSDDTTGLTDEKLKKILYIINIDGYIDSEHWGINKIISYLSQYKDLILDWIKQTTIDQYKINPIDPLKIDL